MLNVDTFNRDNTPLDDAISNDEILNSLKSLRKGCAPGPDGTCIEMFKNTIHVSLNYLNKLFNAILNSGNFPPEWCTSLITPVHKRGPQTDPNNFRAISVGNCVGKLFMKILSERLTFWSEAHSVIDEAQAGFRSGYSTVDNIFNLAACIQKHITILRLLY